MSHRFAWQSWKFQKKFELNRSNLQVADSVEDALEDGHALRLYHPESLFILHLNVEAGHGKNMDEDKDESRPEVAVAPGVGEEDEGNQPRRDLEDVGEEQD